MNVLRWPPIPSFEQSNTLRVFAAKLEIRQVALSPARQVLRFPRESDELPRGRSSVLLLFRENERLHLHAVPPEGVAKFWLEPEIAVARNFGLSEPKIREALRLVEEHEDEIRAAWREHFRS